MKDFMMNTFSDIKKDVKSKIDKELLQDVQKSYPQNYTETVDNSPEKDIRLQDLHQSFDKLDSFIEENFEKAKQGVNVNVNNKEDKIIDSMDKINQKEDMPKQKDIIRHFELNLQKYSSKCDISQEELESQEIPSSILQYLYSIFSKVGKRMFRKILILVYSFKEIDIKDKVLILSALGYLIAPIDMIPDTLLGIGFADDAVVISYIFNKIITEVSEQTIKKVDNLLSLLEKTKSEKANNDDLDNIGEDNLDEDSLDEDTLSKETEDTSNSVNHLNFFKR